MVKENVTNLKQKIQPKKTKPILCHPNIKSYLELNHHLQAIYHLQFSDSTFSELLPIARCNLRINDFITRASDLFSKMIAQSGNRATLTKQLKKAFYR